MIKATMDEIGFLKDLGVIAVSIIFIYLMIHYVFDDPATIGYGLSLALLMDFSRIAYRYYKFVRFKKEKDYINLKKSTMTLGSFHSPIIMIISFAFFYYTNAAWFIIPFFLAEAIFIYQFERSQTYGFGDWSVKDLSTGRSIKKNDIRKFDLSANKLEISYFEDGDFDKKRMITIRRDELSHPKSWYEFQEIVKRFEENVLKEQPQIEDKINE